MNKSIYAVPADIQKSNAEALEKTIEAAKNSGRCVLTDGLSTAVMSYHCDMVSRLFKQLSEPQMLVHASMGISGEAGELLDAVKKHYFYNRAIDSDNVVEELGDILFYVVAMANLFDVTLVELLAANCAKLELNDNARYKSGQYSNEQAVARADKQ